MTRGEVREWDNVPLPQSEPGALFEQLCQLQRFPRGQQPSPSDRTAPEPAGACGAGETEVGADPYHALDRTRLQNAIARDRTPAAPYENAWMNRILSQPRELQAVADVIHGLGLRMPRREADLAQMLGKVCRHLIRELGSESHEEREAASAGTWFGGAALDNTGESHKW